MRQNILSIASHRPFEALPATGTVPPKPLLGLDVVRAWSAVCVVLLHACVPYATLSMPGLAWSTTDKSDAAVTVVMWAIEIIIMPIFLVMAGFLAARSMSSAGPWTTMRQRIYRLGRPLLLAMILILPLDLYAWLLGWVADGAIGIAKLKSLKFDGSIDENLWGLSHLWFLQYLMTYIVLLAAGWRSITLLLEPRWLFVGCFVTAVLTLTQHNEVVWGFQHSFWPVPSKWLYSFAFFLAGVGLWRRDPNLQECSQLGMRLMTLGVLVWSGAVIIGTWRLQSSTTPLQDFVVAILCVGAAWSVTFGLVGCATRYTKRLDGLTATLARTSFLVYLLHHPLVGLAHVTLKHSLGNLPVAMKVFIALTVGVGLPTMLQLLWQGHFRRVSAQEEILTSPIPQTMRKAA